MDAPRDASCGEPTRDGTPCPITPLSGSGGRCHRHAGLLPTWAQAEAARTNPVKHGYFAKGLIDESERRLYAETAEAIAEPWTIKRELAAFALVRAARVAKWEAESGKPSALATAAFATATRAVAEVPVEAAKDHRCLDDAEIVRQVEALLADPEVFLKRYAPAVQEGIRAVLREAERAHAP